MKQFLKINLYRVGDTHPYKRYLDKQFVSPDFKEIYEIHDFIFESHKSVCNIMKEETVGRLCFGHFRVAQEIMHLISRGQDGLPGKGFHQLFTTDLDYSTNYCVEIIISRRHTPFWRRVFGMFK